MTLGALNFARPAAAQCPNAAIDSALTTAFGASSTVSQYIVLIQKGQPYAAQVCDVNRYAGGSFTAASLPNYVKASVVCQDPWIAQAFFDLGRQLNGHSALVPESTGLFSTRDDCNAANYGSWGNYSILKANVQKHFSGAPAVVTASSPGLVQITGPVTFSTAQTPTVTWRVVTPPAGAACPSGVKLVVNNTIQVANPAVVPITAQQAPLAMRFTSAGPITLTMIDLCSGKVVSNVFTATVTASPINTVVTAVMPTTFPLTQIRGLSPNGAILDAYGNYMTSTTGYYFLGGSGASIVAAGAGNYQASLGGRTFTVRQTNTPTGVLVDNDVNPVKIVAAGAGNFTLQVAGRIVAAGAGNIILNGGSNIILNGAGNIVAAGAGNLQAVTDPALASNMAALTSVLGASVISNDGGSLNQAVIMAKVSTFLNLAQVGPSVVNTNGSNLSNAVQSGTLLNGNQNQVYNLQSVGGYRLLSCQVDSPSWTVMSKHTISWTSSGTPAQNETVSLWLQTSAGLVRLASGIPAAQKSYSLQVNSVQSGTTGTIILKDDLTNLPVNGVAIRVN